MNLDSQKRQQLNGLQIFALNRRVMKAYLLKGKLEAVFETATAMKEPCCVICKVGWDQLAVATVDTVPKPRILPKPRFHAVRSFKQNPELLVAAKLFAFGVVEGINGNIKTLFRRGRGYKNLGYLLLKAQRMAVSKTEFIVFQKAALKCGSLRILVQNQIYTTVSVLCLQRAPGLTALRIISWRRVSVTTRESLCESKRESLALESNIRKPRKRK